MSFESKLREHYMNSAKVGDMKGYGLSGGMSSGGDMKRGYPERVKEIITDADEMHSASFPMAGFRLGSHATMKGRGVVDGGMCHVCGSALSGGVPAAGVLSGGVPAAGVLNMQYPVGLTGLPPMAYGDGAGLSGGVPAGGVLSGGRRKSKSRVDAGKKAAMDNPWIRKVKEYAKKTGLSYKQSMMALKGCK